MKINTFHGASMDEAMKAVRSTLGSTAMILSERTDKNGSVTVVAAAEDDWGDVPQAARASTDVNEMRMPGLRKNTIPSTHAMGMSPEKGRICSREKLRWHGIPEILVDELASAPIERSLSEMIRFGAFSFMAGKAPIAMVGTPGSGKTLSVARLAARLIMSDSIPLVITTERDNGAEQLAIHTRRLGIPLISAGTTDALKRVMRQRKNGQPVLIDTGATDPFAEESLDLIKELSHVTGASLCLALPAGHDVEESADIAESFIRAGTRMMFATRLDQARRIGNIVTAAACGLALTEAGVSPAITGGLVRLTAATLAARLSQSDEKSRPAELFAEIETIPEVAMTAPEFVSPFAFAAS